MRDHNPSATRKTTETFSPLTSVPRASDTGSGRPSHTTSGMPTRRARFLHFLLMWLHRILKRKTQVLSAPRFMVADNDNFRQMTFTFAVIALAAQLAKVDGKVKKEEFVAFCELFPMPFEEKVKIHTLFVMAARERTDVSRYAQQIMQLFPGRSGLMKELFARLCKLAAADGAITPGEQAMLEHIAASLGLSASVHDHALPTVRVTGENPYKLLGISPRISNEALKKAYRARIRELHPDRMGAAGYTPEDILAAHADLAAVNDAYRALARKRKMK